MASKPGLHRHIIPVGVHPDHRKTVPADLFFHRPKKLSGNSVSPDRRQHGNPVDPRIGNVAELPLAVLDPVIVRFSPERKHSGAEDRSILLPDSALSISDVITDNFFRRITVLPLIQSGLSHSPLGIMDNCHDTLKILFLSCSVSHGLIWFRRYGLRHRPDPGRCMRAHSGSDPDDHSRSECPDVPREVSSVLPELR